MEINNILNNPENIYFGHGVGVPNEEKISSILRNGLRCSHGSLYYTSVILGIGTIIRKEEYELLKNWPHKASMIVIIVSLPAKYRIVDNAGIGTYNQADAAYYYLPSKKQIEKDDLTNSPYVSPEFIFGYYDATTDRFEKNPNYYENLSREKQDELFYQIKENYFNIIDDGCGIKEYKEITQELGWIFGLSDEEIEIFKNKKEKNNLLEIINPLIKDLELRIPTGEKIPAIIYLEKYVFPYIPYAGKIPLKSGASIPVWHFIVECVVFDCQNKYYGDFEKYLKENVDVENMLEISSKKR